MHRPGQGYSPCLYLSSPCYTKHKGERRMAIEDLPKIFHKAIGFIRQDATEAQLDHFEREFKRMIARRRKQLREQKQQRGEKSM